MDKIFYSNCLIEAVKAKLKDWKHVKLYYCKPCRGRDGTLHSFHILWDDGVASYDFSSINLLPWYRSLLYKGCITSYSPGLAKFISNVSKRKNK